jgi:hypothetical protein
LFSLPATISNGTPQSEDPEDDISERNVSMHSEEATEEERQEIENEENEEDEEGEEDEEDVEDEEDEDAALLSHPRQLVRFRGLPLVHFRTNPLADFILYTPSLTHLNLRF